MIALLAKKFIKDCENVTSPAVRQAYGMLCGIVGICLNIVLFALKFFAGTISGSVSLTADAVIEIPAAADGTIPMATITGKLDASRGGVIRLVGSGSRLQPGRYTVIPAASFASAPVAADWTFETVGDIGRRVATMAFVDGALVVDVSAFGMTVILK